MEIIIEDDESLLKNFYKNFETNVKFIKRLEYKSKIKDILKNLIDIETKIKTISSGKFPSYIIPIEQKDKIQKFHELWETLLKEAIYCLRDNDEMDQNKFRQDFGIIEIKEYFEKFSDFEEVLYGTDKYYRDHSLHVIRVFLLGFYLLSTENNNNIVISFQNIKYSNEELKSRNEELKPNDEEQEIQNKQAVWTLISLTHDLGYPIEHIDKINKKTRKIIEYYGPSGIEEFKYHLPLQNQILNDFILKFISSKLIKQSDDKYYTAIQNKYYLKFAEAFEKFSHGIMSCILLMKHLTYFKESNYSHSHLNLLNKNDAIQFLIRSTILRCIASHDNDEIYHIFPNTFVFLLTFCDDLQEWDRPNVQSRFNFNKSIEIKSFNFKKISFNITYTLNEEIIINIDMMEIFARRVKRYIRLFRSGPKSEERPFNFIFSLNCNKNPTKKNLIEFIYPPKKGCPKITNPILEDNKDYLDYFLNYIEKDYDSKCINELIDCINSKKKT